MSDLEQGLCFIPISIDSVLAVVLNGKFDFVNSNFRRHAYKIGKLGIRNRRQDLTDFPIERARIEVALPLVYGSGKFTIGSRWLVEKPVNLAETLIFLVFLGYTASGVSRVVTVLNLDIASLKPGTAPAALDLVRCLIGASSLAGVSPIIKSSGRGWTFTFAGPLVIVLFSYLACGVHCGGEKERRRKQQD